MSSSENDTSDIENSTDEENTLVNRLSKFTLRPSRLQLNTNINNNTNTNTVNMTTTTMSEIENLVKIVPEYNGNIHILNNFINKVDQVYEILRTFNLSNIQKLFLFGLISNKLKDKAAEYLSTNDFQNWEDLKQFLQDNFVDKSKAETILLEIIYCKAKISPETTLSSITERFNKYKSKILLTNYSQEIKRAIINENQKVVVHHFITLLPISIKASFVVKNPSTLEECEQLLRNEFNFIKTGNSPMLLKNNDSFKNNIPPQRFPGQQFPQGKINMKPNNPIAQKPFAPRQNIINYQQTKRDKPTQMSLQTRSTLPMSTQTIKQNYNCEIKETDDDLDEFNNENVEEIIETENFHEVLETENIT